MNLSKFNKAIKVVLGSILALFFIVGSANAIEIINQDGDFTVQVESSKEVYTDNLTQSFEIQITNNLDEEQEINLTKPDMGKEWNVSSVPESVVLDPQEEDTFSFNIDATGEFDYRESTRTPDRVLITRYSTYIGEHNFPIIINGENEEISFNLDLIVLGEDEESPEFNIQLSEVSISPEKPLQYTISAEYLTQTESVDINVEIGNKTINSFSEEFGPDENYKIFEQEISPEISPGSYPLDISVRFEHDEGVVTEWLKQSYVDIEEFRNVETQKTTSSNFLGKTKTIDIENKGNVLDNYEYSTSINFFQKLVFNSENEFIEENGKVTFAKELEKGESKCIEYSYNYIPYYFLLLLVVIFVAFFIIRKKSNPLATETKIHNIKRVTYEGIKSLKVEIGIENLKETELDQVRIIFRMPSYLKVKDNSFQLTEPNKVFKGKNQYKLIWDFKNFGVNESRVIGFTLENSKGVLGDIRIPNLEIQVTRNGKTRKYYKSMPTVKS